MRIILQYPRSALLVALMTLSEEQASQHDVCGYALKEYLAADKSCRSLQLCKHIAFLHSQSHISVAGDDAYSLGDVYQ